MHPVFLKPKHLIHRDHLSTVIYLVLSDSSSVVFCCFRFEGTLNVDLDLVLHVNRQINLHASCKERCGVDGEDFFLMGREAHIA